MEENAKYQLSFINDNRVGSGASTLSTRRSFVPYKWIVVWHVPHVALVSTCGGSGRGAYQRVRLVQFLESLLQAVIYATTARALSAQSTGKGL